MEAKGEVVVRSLSDRCIKPGFKQNLLATMVATFEYMGYTKISARLPGRAPPPLLAGTHHDVRPDCRCHQNDSRQTPLFLEVVVSADYLDEEGFMARMTLLNNCREIYGTEIHIAVPTMKLDGEWLADRVKGRLALHNITANRIWVL